MPGPTFGGMAPKTHKLDGQTTQQYGILWPHQTSENFFSFQELSTVADMP
jgi:hypothetical protein